MKILFYIFATLAFSSCSTPELGDILIEKIHLYESCKEKYLDVTTIEILRRQSKPRIIEYKIKKDSLAGYAIVQTYPKLNIFRNIYSDSISLDFVSCLNNFNEGMSIRLLKFEKKLGVVNFELKINDKKVILRNAKTMNSFLNSSDSSIILNENWNYIVKSFVGEK